MNDGYYKVIDGIKFNNHDKSDNSAFVMRKKWYSVGGGSRKYQLYPIPAAFDIETTNIAETKTAYMYIWQFAFGADVYVGRTWDAFFSCLDNLKLWYNKARIMIFIHNMSFEMSFLLPQIYSRGLLDSIFARDEREPLEVRLTNGIIFRDSMALTNLGLAELAEKYTTTQKMVGDLDYTVLRNSTTPLTEKEMQYCINDVVILKEYAETLHAEYTVNGKLIPLTSTGIVRQFVKSQLSSRARHSIQLEVANLFPTSIEKYNFTFKWLYRGGFTHAQTAACDVDFNIDCDINDYNHKCSAVDSYDLTSAYPAMILQKLYPITPFLRYDPEMFDKVIDDPYKAAIITVTFIKIRAVTDHVVESLNKIMYHSPNSIFENGRLYYSDEITVALTDVDYHIYKKFYTWRDMFIGEMHVANKGELPKYVINSVFHFYNEKKRLKKELKKLKEGTPEYIKYSGYYQNAKGMLNSIYGMMVSRIHLEQWDYNGDYYEKPIVKNKETGEYKTYDDMIHEQILSPYWGIYITAYCRETILKSIAELGSAGSGEMALYSDTDSIKCLPGCDAYFENYNENIAKLNKGICERFEKDYNIYGDIGFFDKEHTYKRFKTFGAKRYVYVNEKDEFNAVVAGLPKKTTQDWVKEYGVDAFFQKFSPSMTFEVSGKNAHRYKGESTYNVLGENMHELGSCYIYPVTFQMTVEPAFLDIIHIRKEVKEYGKKEKE